MAKKQTKLELTRVICANCANSYDPHELDYSGKPFLCHCKAKGEWGAKFSVFLYKPQECKDYKPKKDA